MMTPTRAPLALSRRREFLQVGTLGLGALSLSGLLRARAEAANEGKTARDTSVVFLFLTGGPSHIETFDPKMTAPAEYRSITGETATRIPGVTFGGTFPQLAQCAHRMAVVRSFSHETSDHTRAVQQVIRGGNSGEAGMGAIMARLRGTSHPASGMPTHIYLNETELDPQFDKERQRLLEAAGPGQLGGGYAPFPLGFNSPVSRDLQLCVSRRCLEDRRAMRSAFDQVAREVDTDGSLATLDRFDQQAFEILVGRSRGAFDLSREDPRIVARYDTRRYQTGIKEYRSSPLGLQLLLARRLCEAGCGFVTIHNPGWDMHGGDTQLNMRRGMDELGRPLDHAVAAFLEDVEQRGLSQKILLVITGEFGRTPRINASGGRDHWPQLSTLALAGGGLRMGQIVGESTARADVPKTNPVSIANLLATVMHVLLDDDARRRIAVLPGAVAASVAGARPIAGLI
ncbi:MAG: DUF1501 domain-containing protein [Gemmataceae bacterium]|nr:DUF1501 domain-containing protein [Gemmataceae bacterium]